MTPYHLPKKIGVLKSTPKKSLFWEAPNFGRLSHFHCLLSLIYGLFWLIGTRKPWIKSLYLPLMWSKYCKSLISICRVINSSKKKKKKKKPRQQQDKQVQTFRHFSSKQPIMLDESCKDKRRKRDPASFCKNRGPCPWLVVSAGLLKILLQQLYWLFCEEFLKNLALGFLSVSILRSNKEVEELPNWEAVVKDI